jgi:hypothetical protein
MAHDAITDAVTGNVIGVDMTGAMLQIARRDCPPQRCRSVPTCLELRKPGSWTCIKLSTHPSRSLTGFTFVHDVHEI